MLRSCLSKSRFFMATLAGLVSLTGSLMLFTCTKDNPVSEPEPTWDFTLDVINGYTGDKIPGASVQYMNVDRVDTTFQVNAVGRIKIEGLSAGTQSFNVFYGGTDTSLKFTSVVVEARSVADTAAGLNKLADQAQTVKLFPLHGALSGRIVRQVNPMAPKVSVAGVVVSVSYDNPDLATASNKAFQTNTDSTGAFSFSGLPVAAGLNVTINAVAVGGIDFMPEDFDMPVLVSKMSVPMGTIIMSPVDADKFVMLGSLPSVIAPNDSIVLTYSDPVDSLSFAKLEGQSGSQSVAIAVKIKGSTITIVPAMPLVDGNTYRLAVNAYGKAGGEDPKSGTITVRGGNLIDVVASNVLDANKQAVGGFALTQSLWFKFRDSVTSATASVSDGNTIVDVKVAVLKDTVIVTPVASWPVTANLSIRISANLKGGTAATIEVNNVPTTAGMAVVSSNIMDNNWGGVNGLGYNQPITIRINKEVKDVSASLARTVGGSSINVPVTIKVSADTIVITPKENLETGISYTLSYTITTADNQVKSSTAPFTTAASKTYVVASNVLGADNFGLKNVAVDVSPWYKLSDTVSAENITVELKTGGTTVPTVVSVNGDTVKVDPVKNLDVASSYSMKIRGKTKGGELLEIDLSATNKQFTTRQAVYLVATNTMDAGQENDAVNFPFYGEMWVKFSEDLDADPNKIVWSLVSGGAKTLYGNPNSDNYNATARVSHDTLFVTPNQALVNLNYGNVVGFQVNVTTASGRTTGNMEFSVTYMESDLYVKWTNTKNVDGSIKETFGILDTIVLVSSKKLKEITNVTIGGLGGAALPPDITLDNIKLSASGDTIRYIPSVRMATNTVYSIDFDVKRDDGITVGTAGALEVSWKTAEGVRIGSVNNRKDGLFRPFKVIGDSLVVEFSKAIDVAKTFKVNSFVTKYTVAWSAENKVATIKNVDTLTAGSFDALPYTNGAATSIYNNLTFTLTTTDGETKAALTPTGGNLDIHVEPGLWVESASYIRKADAASPVGTTNGSAIDTIAKGANLTVVFNRALDTNAIKADSGNLYQHILTLHKHGATVLLEVALTFSSDAKTLTINPKQDLENGVSYAVSFINVPAGLGSMNNYAGAAVEADNSLINNYDFKVAALPIVDISKIACAIIMDTNTTPDKRKGYSPAAASYAGDVADNTMMVKVKQIAWNAKHQDSVTCYQFRYRKHNSDSWYVDGNLVGDINYSSFHSAAQLAENEWQEASVAIDAAHQSLSYMLTADKDGAGTDYTNGDNWLNSGAVVDIQARAVFDSDDDNNLATGTQAFGAWSNAVSFQDDIAPGDATFGIASVTQADDANMDGTTGDAIDWDNFNASNRTVGIIVTFPEDMDVTTTTPTIDVYNALGNAETPPVKVAASSRWLTARKYLLAVEQAAGTNYNDEVEFSEMAEGATTNWTLNSGAYEFAFDAFASSGPNAAPISAGVFNGTKVMGTKLTANGFYSEGATAMTGAAYDIGGASANQGQYILQSGNINVENYTGGSIILEFNTVYDLEAGDKVDLEGDLDGNGTFESLLATYTGTQYTTWSAKSILLNSAINVNNVKIRFRLRADASSSESTAHGFFVDNLRVRYNGSDSWYYSIKVDGMKDASGVTCQASGSVGNAANDRAMTAVTGAVTGNRNVGGLTLCQ